MACIANLKTSKAAAEASTGSRRAPIMQPAFADLSVDGNRIRSFEFRLRAQIDFKVLLVLHQKASKLVWDMLILKILDSHPDGEVTTSEIAREVALLDSAARESFLPSPPIEGGIFGAGFVVIPRKGVWRISDRGRQYVRSANPRRVPARAEASVPPDVEATERTSHND
jgi:hypothetical protein